MSDKTRSLLRAAFALPIAAVLALGTSQVFASPPTQSGLPECSTYCMQNAAYCEVNPTASACRYCGCGL